MFTTIVHPFREAFNLSITEYCVLDSIYHLSHNRKYFGWCVASKEYIAKTLGLGERTVYNAMKALEAKELIERNERGDVRTLDIWNEMMANKDDWIVAFKGKESQFITGKPLSKAKNLMPTAKIADTMKKLQPPLQKLQSDPAKIADNIYNNNYSNTTTKAEDIFKTLKCPRDEFLTAIEDELRKYPSKDLVAVARKCIVYTPFDTRWLKFVNMCGSEFANEKLKNENKYSKLKTL